MGNIHAGGPITPNRATQHGAPTTAIPRWGPTTPATSKQAGSGAASRKQSNSADHRVLSTHTSKHSAARWGAHTPSNSSSKLASSPTNRPLDSWTCDVCEIEFQHTDRLQLSTWKSNRIKDRHSDVPRHKFTKLRSQQPVVLAQPPSPEVQFKWQCAFCNHGLPKLAPKLHERSVRHRYDTKHKRRKVSVAKILIARARLHKQRKTNPETAAATRSARQKAG